MTLSACQTGPSPLPQPPASPHALFLQSLRNHFPAHFSLEILQQLIHKGDFSSASRYVNVALNTSPHSPALHLVNGFLYEEMARRGDNTKTELAGIAYRSAYSLDRTHWAYPYLLGVYELKERLYEEAQKHLAEALMLRPNDPDILYGLACASYYLKDIPLALSSIRKAAPLRPQDPVTQRAAAVISAAGAQFDQASHFLTLYQKLVGSGGAEDVAHVQQRIEDWKKVHAQSTFPSSSKAAPVEEPENTEEDSKILAKTPVIILDCCLLSMTETTNTSKGNNVFKALSVTLGGSGDKFQFTRKISRPAPNQRGIRPIAGEWTKTFKYSINPRAERYALKIMNAKENVAEFVARPTVSTFLGKKATFLNSDRITGTVGGSAAPSQINVDAGVRIEITPLAIRPDGLVTLEITLVNSSFKNPPRRGEGIDKQMVSLTKATTSTTINVYLGQTALVSALHADTRVTTDSRFPLLGSIPIIQYFFADVDPQGEQRTFLYLVTPRLGGALKNYFRIPRATQPSMIGEKLASQDLVGAHDYYAVYHILRHLERSPMFADFRSGDVILPFWGYGFSSLSEKLDQLKAFLYF